MRYLNLYDSNNQLLPSLDVRLFNDLHLEFEDTFRIPDLKKNQVIVLAGDIGRQGRGKVLNDSLKRFLEDTLYFGVIIIYVTGNHEYYGSRIDKVNRLIRQFDEKNENFYFLNDESVFINDTEFLGGTLWTDLNNEDPNTFLEIGGTKQYGKTANTQNDYHKISIKESKNGKDNFTKLRTRDTVKFHKKTLNYIKSRVGKHDKQVVVTHFPPSEIFLDKERWENKYEKGYDYNISKYAYYSELEYLAENFDYWFSGHTHYSVNTIKNGVHYISNPRGYFEKDDDDKEDLVITFKNDFIIKI
jgi:predicted phosphodiesterase